MQRVEHANRHRHCAVNRIRTRIGANHVRCRMVGHAGDQGAAFFQCLCAPFYLGHFAVFRRVRRQDDVGRRRGAVLFHGLGIFLPWLCPANIAVHNKTLKIQALSLPQNMPLRKRSATLRAHLWQVLRGQEAFATLSPTGFGTVMSCRRIAARLKPSQTMTCISGCATRL